MNSIAKIFFFFFFFLAERVVEKYRLIITQKLKERKKERKEKDVFFNYISLIVIFHIKRDRSRVKMKTHYLCLSLPLFSLPPLSSPLNTRAF